MPESRPERRRNPRGQGRLLREQLIEATGDLLATLEHPETLTLRQVAREVGVAPASIYSHFPDLGALVQHVLLMRYAELAALMDTAAARATDPLGDLCGRAHAYVRWGVAHPGEYRTLFGGGISHGDVSVSAHGAGEALLSAVVASLAEARLPHPDATSSEDPWEAGLLLWTGLHGLVGLYNDHGAMDWPSLDTLITSTVALHTRRLPEEIAARMGALAPDLPDATARGHLGDSPT
ncbi:TetR/AcrR family transcriptional regulator [Demequina sp. NBRC 110055]|uniref:TetR/AcrR family transcriptional regulator n=1 Tax=Demequina sp. NBRC 110055 TaxID=1570344 RepID=UPI000A0555F1|nr:TetR/AcrR family transcriptional regulator [Demequina sp. NBRC 110055]